MTLTRPVVTPGLAEERLKLIFPPAAFDTVLSNRLAASAVAAMIYVGAVVDDEAEEPQPEGFWARPATVVGMSDEALAHTDPADREAWARAEAASTARVVELLDSWVAAPNRWYAANTRETLRDETWPKWWNYGAARRREGIPTNSSLPRWALNRSFADLFDPDLTDDALTEAIAQWRDTHLSPGDRLRIAHANELAKAGHRVEVNVPSHGVRQLEPGAASAILKGVLEEWAPRRLGTPAVIAISEPGAKVWVIDAARMAAAGISINVSEVLPDAILLDASTRPPTFCSSRPSPPMERSMSSASATCSPGQNAVHRPDHCQFLSAFTSRNSNPARRRLKDIAVGTFCWFLDEPGRELAWDELPEKP